jgi:uncharacterized protein
MTDRQPTGVRAWAQRHRIVAFVILTYAIMNAAWWPMVLTYPGMTMEQHFTTPSHLPFVYLAGASPTWAALFLTYFLDGKAGLAALVRKFKVRAPLWTWIAAFALPMLAAITAILIYRGFFGSLGPVAWPIWYLIIPPFALILFIARPLCEETGWRGFLQPLIVERYSIFTSSFIIGTIWTFWHVPFMLTPGGTSPIDAPIDLVQYWLGTIIDSGILVVLITCAKSSIPVAMLYHWSFNASMSAVIQPLFPRVTEAQFHAADNLRLGISIIIFGALLLWAGKALQPMQRDMAS